MYGLLDIVSPNKLFYTFVELALEIVPLAFRASRKQKKKGSF